ncbi:MAG: T9SS type A sorting domain-containing protein [Ignavibacteria bacterium]|nr:T9SS type A sorting domain-containing protein [Ignavibacteria bacterium]
MKKLLSSLVVFSALFFIENSIAQNFLDHSTGNLTASVMDDGAFGVNDSTYGFPGHVGNGVVFMGNINASYTGGLIIGNSSTKCSGHLASFNIMFEMLTSTPFPGFTSNPNFNQIATCVFSDSGAPTINQLGLSVQQTSYSNTGDNFVILDFTITNNTASPVNDVYVGQFQDWDIGVTQYFNNNGGYDQSRNLAYQYLNGGNPDPSYYGIVALSGWSGARVTTLWNPSTVRDSAYEWMSTFLDEAITTNGDYRTFVGCGPYDFDVSESIRVGFAYVAGVDLTSLQDASTAAQFSWNNFVIPVELTSFTGSSFDGNVILNWTTATEINNKIFNVERRKENSDFVTVGFVEGKGTTTERQEYSYIDRYVTAGKYFYRLKQIDFDGTFEYSNEIEVDATTLLSFSLEQNYPNPFNPSTKITYSIPDKSFVTLKVFDPLGREISQLVNEEKEAGKYEIEFDANNLSSGVYFYKIEAVPIGRQAGDFVETKKMILLR